MNSGGNFQLWTFLAMRESPAVAGLVLANSSHCADTANAFSLRADTRK
jgi:hypothetical protein